MYPNLFFFYRIRTKAIKWYKRVLYHFIDLSLVNSYILNKVIVVVFVGIWD